jgi:hypothetical protein
MFELKSYSRKELAMLYFPANKPVAAYYNLKRWVQRQPEGKKLWESQYHNKILSKDAVKAIVDLLGEP